MINTLIAGNCIEVLTKVDNEFVELTVTSPPYDNLRDYNGYSFNFEEIAKQFKKRW